MSFSCNKTTLVVIHGIAKATLIKQPIPLRVACLVNTGVVLYCNNKKGNNLESVAISNITSFVLGFTLAIYVKKYKQHKRGLCYMVASTLLDKMD